MGVQHNADLMHATQQMSIDSHESIEHATAARCPGPRARLSIRAKDSRRRVLAHRVRAPFYEPQRAGRPARPAPADARAHGGGGDAAAHASDRSGTAARRLGRLSFRRGPDTACARARARAINGVARGVRRPARVGGRLARCVQTRAPRSALPLLRPLLPAARRVVRSRGGCCVPARAAGRARAGAPARAQLALAGDVGRAHRDQPVRSARAGPPLRRHPVRLLAGAAAAVPAGARGRPRSVGRLSRPRPPPTVHRPSPRGALAEPRPHLPRLHSQHPPDAPCEPPLHPTHAARRGARRG